MLQVVAKGNAQHVGCKMVLSPIAVQQRHITRLYTSFYKGEIFPNQLVRPTQRASQFRDLLKSGYGPAPSKSSATPTAQQEGRQQSSETAAPEWRNASSLDVLRSNESAGVTEALSPKRPYVPLQDAAEVELKGDYCTEGGLYQEALECYGVVATLYNLAYPDNHSQRAGIAIKLGTAFRNTGRLESSRANLEHALRMLDASTKPSLELICECLMELGLTAEAMGSHSDAGAIFEDVLAAVEAFHSSGESHRMLRLLPRLGRRFNLNFEQKFVYFSPFDYDRTFAIADQSLNYAERCYKAVDDVDGIVRALTARKQLMDKKYFNMRDFAGKMRTMRGHWMRRARHLTNAPTPEELLLYSPTIHQVHRDFRYEVTAPLGHEDEVAPGINRVVLDDGTPYRRTNTYTSRDIRIHGGSKQAEAKKQWE